MEYITVKGESKSQIIIKKSKFITHLKYVENKEEARKYIEIIRKKYFDAKHNCYAYIVKEDNGLYEKYSDDAEPSGTAGMPILNVLKQKKLYNVVAIVTRYFGGILLGTGGLVRAYSDALLEALEKTSKVKMVSGLELEVTLSYNNFENFKYYCKNHEINIISTNYNENIVCKIDMKLEKKVEFDRDYENKRLNLMEYKELNIKYIKKSI